MNQEEATVGTATATTTAPEPQIRTVTYIDPKSTAEKTTTEVTETTTEAP